MEGEEKMIKESAVNRFKSGYNCAQAVLGAYSDITEVSIETLLKISNGFGAGIGRKQETCGAVTGGIMVLGMIYGRGEGGEKSEQEKCYSKVQTFTRKFEQKHGSINCMKLLDGCCLMTPEGQERFKSEKMIERCQGYVATAVEILEEER